ncbi:MAG: hypothetical protein NW220_16250 [Leptolyngbyaceae cyanobacterium bins.349]|nr:hypothetical protein [Leptolyngbyaceae cyanobacterium bins.349]
MKPFQGNFVVTHAPTQTSGLIQCNDCADNHYALSLIDLLQ